MSLEGLVIRSIHSFVKDHVESFSEELIRSILLSNEVSEYTIRDFLNCKPKQEKKSSFRNFRKNQMENKQQDNDDVILVI